jgi:hypothetical protein
MRDSQLTAAELKTLGLTAGEFEALRRAINRDPKVWHMFFRAVCLRHGRTLHCADCEAPFSTIPLECDCGSQAFILEPAVGSTEPPVLIETRDGIFRWWLLECPKGASRH